MIFLFKNFKLNKKIKCYKLNSGMSIIELLVVLSIFAAISSVAIFNFGDFQNQVDIKNLASDIAIKTVEAQKSSLSGLLPPLAQQSQIDETWKPSYGVFFDLVPLSENINFIYFTDLKNPTQNSLYDSSSCPGSGECLEKITITKGNKISNLSVLYVGNPTPQNLDDLAITFVRPNSSAVLYSAGAKLLNVSYVQIDIISPKMMTATIKVFPSGRIQVD